MDHELKSDSLLHTVLHEGVTVTPETQAKIDSVIESAKSKIIREFRNLYSIKYEIWSIIVEGVQYMRNEYHLLKSIYPNATREDRQLSKIIARRKKNMDEECAIDVRTKRRNYNSSAIKTMYEQVPKRIATILSVEDPKGRAKHLEAEQLRRRQLFDGDVDIEHPCCLTCD